MEEQEYKATYKAVNTQRCIFEKTITSRRSSCTRSCRFHLADREGIACSSPVDLAVCTRLLDRMRSNARFALHRTHATGPLPHAREIKVQTGGMLGLQALVYPERKASTQVDNIIDIINQAFEKYRELDRIPYDVINQSIVKFTGRRKRTHRD